MVTWEKVIIFKRDISMKKVQLKELIKKDANQHDQQKRKEKTKGMKCMEEPLWTCKLPKGTKKYNMIKSWHGNKGYMNLMMQQDKEQNEWMNPGTAIDALKYNNVKIYVSEFDIKWTLDCASTKQNIMIKK